MRLAASKFFLTLFSASILLSGCLLKTTAPSDSALGVPLSGRVHGGQQPVVGAHIYLFAAGTTGYGAASTSLLTSRTVGSDSLGQYVISDSNGAFSITGDYSCVSGMQLYVLATQGNPGLPGNQTNPNLALMTAVGQCPATGNIQATVPFIFINEVSTVASVYALSGFMTDLAHVSSSGTPLALAGIAQAFAAVRNLVDISTGAALATTPAGNGTVPQAEINSLANILASCVNSNGASSSPCTTLFANAQSGGTVPNDTLTAALYIAQNPGANISNLFAIPPPTSPFQPSLSSAPNDFTIALKFTGGGLSQPLAIAIDGTGSVWAGSSLNATLNQFNGSTGAAISSYTGGGLAFIQGVAIDPFGNTWASSYAQDGGGTFDAISKFNSAGLPLSPSTGYALPHGTNPLGLAIDSSGNIWPTNVGGPNLFKLDGTGSIVSPAGYTGGGLNEPVAIAIDSSGNVWAANNLGNSVSLLNGSTGDPISPSTGYTGGGLNQPNGIAIDSSGNIWVSNSAHFNQFGQLLQAGSVSELNGSTGAPISPSSGYNAGGSLTPSAIAVDGIGNVWVLNGRGAPGCNPPSNQNCATLARLNSTGAVTSGPVGYTSNTLFGTMALAIDGAGNIWVQNSTTSSLTEFVGLAAPVVTPLAVAVANHSIATRP
jgi:streptogramin lyase